MTGRQNLSHRMGIIKATYKLPYDYLLYSHWGPRAPVFKSFTLYPNNHSIEYRTIWDINIFIIETAILTTGFNNICFADLCFLLFSHLLCTPAESLGNPTRIPCIISDEGPQCKRALTTKPEKQAYPRRPLCRTISSNDRSEERRVGKECRL